MNVAEKLKVIEAEVLKGRPIEELLKSFSWKEFEDFCAHVFEINGFQVLRNFRFKSRNKRFEVDIVAVRGALILCADCKRWGFKTGSFSSLAEAVEKQAKRAQALSQRVAELYKLIKLKNAKEISIIPILISLHEKSMKIYDGIPIVPIFKLNNFLNEFDVYVSDLKVIKASLS